MDKASASEYRFHGGTFYCRTFGRAQRRVSRVCAEGRVSRVACFRAFKSPLGRELSKNELVMSPLFGTREAFFILSATTKTYQYTHDADQVPGMDV